MPDSTFADLYSTGDSNGYIAVPGQPGLCCQLWCIKGMGNDERWWVKYRGSREQILWLGIVDAGALEPWKRGQPRGRVDLDGETIFVSRQWVGSAGEQPQLRFCVDLMKTRARLAQLPGGALLLEKVRLRALADEEKDRRDLEARRASQLQTDEHPSTQLPRSGNVIPFKPRR
jgi:hypothetical protein